MVILTNINYCFVSMKFNQIINIHISGYYTS